MTDTTEGIELPTEPGVWLHKVHTKVAYLVYRHPDTNDLRVQRIGIDNGLVQGLDHRVELLTRGGWLPATSAPAKDDTLGLLRQHSRSPAPEELARVKGRRAYIESTINGRCIIHNGDSKGMRLVINGRTKLTEWKSYYKVLNIDDCAWPTREAALAFLAAHADQPAAVSPRTFEDWRNDEADDATAATAEQGDESERIKIMAAGCAEALRIQQEIVARLRGKLPKPIVGSLETYLPPGFYVIATEDAGLFDHQIVSCTDIDSGAMTIGFTYYRIDDIIEAAEAELATLKRQRRENGNDGLS